MRVLAIDPGPEKSGVVLWTGAKVLRSDSEYPNRLMFADTSPFLRHFEAVVFEKIESMGMIVGAEVFETAFETGRMFQWARVFDRGGGVHRMTRRAVKLHLCGSMRAKDANIRQALIDRFGAPGTKKNPGPLYGVKSHAWAALALAVTYYDLNAR